MTIAPDSAVATGVPECGSGGLAHRFPWAAPPLARLVALGRLFAFLLASYAATRLLFLWLNRATITRLPGADVALAFLHGPRFDVAALSVLNLPLVLMLVFPLPARRDLAGLRVAFFLALNVPFFWLGLLDAEYVKFTGKRSGRDIAAFKAEAVDQASSLFAQYWPLVLAAAVGTALFAMAALAVEKSLSRSTRGKSVTPPATGAAPLAWKRVARLEAFVFLLVAATLALGIRGGLQRKPLTTTHAYLFEAGILNLLSLNSTLTVLHAGRQRGIATPVAFRTLEEARARWQAVDPAIEGAPRPVPEGEPAWRSRPGKETAASARPNIVVVIVESLGREYMGAGNPWKGHTPFLDSLARDGLLFDDGFAGGRRSIEAPWSVFAGIPSLMDEPYVTSAYKDNKLAASPRLLRDAGYSTAFFHGGKNGTMFFDIFARLAGFERFYGMSEYPAGSRDRDYDGTWGIFDGPFLSFTASTLASLPRPFLAGVFTLSSHNPYALPEGTEARYREGTTLAIHPVVRYADDALRDFFERARGEPWFDETVFIVTGDHTSTTEHEEYQDDLGFNRVPILLWSASRAFHPGLARRVAQHSDIACTLTDLAGVADAPATPFCRSLLDPAFGGRTILKSGDMHNLVTPRYWIRRPAGGEVTVFSRGERTRWLAPKGTAGTLADPATARALSLKLDAGLQAYAGGLNADALYGPP